MTLGYDWFMARQAGHDVQISSLSFFYKLHSVDCFFLTPPTPTNHIFSCSLFLPLNKLGVFPSPVKLKC
jgi:hypothetical protein